MALTEEEGKKRRRDGVAAMTGAAKIRRDLTGGKPPASELKTPQAAVTAARILHRELESRMTAAGLKPKPGDWAVSIGYVSPDLSVLGYTRLFTPGGESALMGMLEGQIAIGLIFGIVDKDPVGERHIILGTRAFLTTKQAEGWLSELFHGVRLEMEDEERGRQWTS